MKKLLFALALVLTLFAAPVWATDYYVASTGADTNNGTSDSTPFAHHPWDLPATDTANSTTLVGDDIVYMRRGETWFNIFITSATAGTSGHQITTTSTADFSTGDGALPRLIGATDPDDLTWSDQTGYYTASVTIEPEQVAYDGALLTANDSATTAVALNEWDWEDDVLYVNVGEDPATGELLSAVSDNVIYSSKEYLTWSNLNLNMSGGDLGVAYFRYSNGSEISDCTISLGFTGAYVRSKVAVNSCTITEMTTRGINISGIDGVGTIVSGNTISSGIMQTGVYLNGSDNWVISNNNISDCLHGVQVANSTRNQILNNTITNCWDGAAYPASSGAGVYLYVASDNTTVSKNIITGCCRGITKGYTLLIGGSIITENLVTDSIVNGIDIMFGGGTTRPLITNNVVIQNPPGTSGHGIGVQCGGSGAMIFNNIIIVKKSISNVQGIAIAGDYAVDGVQINNNLVFDDSPEKTAHLYQFDGTQIDTLVAWKTAIQADAAITDENGTSGSAGANSLVADPLLTTDYYIPITSPCVGAGLVVAGVHDQATAWTDIAGNTSFFTPSIGAYEPARARIYFDADATGVQTGTQACPFSALTDYTWTGYNVRAGGIIRLQPSDTAYGVLDLSGLTDTGEIAVEVIRRAKLTGFVTNGDGYVAGVNGHKSGLRLGLGLGL